MWFGCAADGDRAVIALVRPCNAVSRGEQINGAVRVYAGYLFSRYPAFAVLLVGTLIVRRRVALDAGIDCVEGRWMLLPGVLLLGVLFLVGALRASKMGVENA